MVKVLENQLIDLDLMPGLKPADLYNQAAALEAKSPEKAAQLRTLAGQRAAALTGEIERKTKGVPLSLGAAAPAGAAEGQEGEEEKAVVELKKENGNVVVRTVEGVGMGLLGTVGALGKGVGDTLGNTVYALGSGLVGTGSGVAGGLAKTGKAVVPVGNGKTVEVSEDDAGEVKVVGPGPDIKVSEDPNVEVQEGTDAQAEEEAAAKRPRKIEIRSSKVAETDFAAGQNAGETIEERGRLASSKVPLAERIPTPSPGRFPDTEAGVGVLAGDGGDIAGPEPVAPKAGEDEDRGRDELKVNETVRSALSRSPSPRLDQPGLPENPRLVRVETDSPSEDVKGKE